MSDTELAKPEHAPKPKLFPPFQAVKQYRAGVIRLLNEDAVRGGCIQLVEERVYETLGPILDAHLVITARPHTEWNWNRGVIISLWALCEAIERIVKGWGMTWAIAPKEQRDAEKKRRWDEKHAARHRDDIKDAYDWQVGFEAGVCSRPNAKIAAWAEEAKALGMRRLAIHPQHARVVDHPSGMTQSALEAIINRNLDIGERTPYISNGGLELDVTTKEYLSKVLTHLAGNLPAKSPAWGYTVGWGTSGWAKSPIEAEAEPEIEPEPIEPVIHAPLQVEPEPYDPERDLPPLSFAPGDEPPAAPETLPPAERRKRQKDLVGYQRAYQAGAQQRSLEDVARRAILDAVDAGLLQRPNTLSWRNTSPDEPGRPVTEGLLQDEYQRASRARRRDER